MVRGNWQRRVEKTEARRAFAKQKKQKKDNRATLKAMIAVLVATLDKRRVSLCRMHIWTDTAPSDSVAILDLYDEEEGSKNKRRGRSHSFTETPKTRKHPPDGAKKVHPRSKEADIDDEEIVSIKRQLCCDQFYRGRCERQGAKKGASCRYVHITKSNKTLCDVLGKDKHQALSNAEEAMIDALMDDEEYSGGLEMLYHFSIDLTEGDFSQETSLLGQILLQALSDKSCLNTSLVYVALENTLIFDRYEDGVIDSALADLFEEAKRLRSASVISEASEEISQIEQSKAGSIPAPILEYILSFLPDTSVLIMSLVCRAWNDEIGTTSPALWRHLLCRRGWPLPPESNSDIVFEDIKKAFTTHYQVVRDMNAVIDALVGIISPRKYIPEDEMVYQTFSSRRKAPAFPNTCVSVEVWSTTTMIAAYSHDCTLRLFKAVEKEDGKVCRELVSVCVNPYRKTKRHNARLITMALDDAMIASLLHVRGEGSEMENYMLSIISRDHYLESSGCDTSLSLGYSEVEDGVLNVINIGEAVVNYLVSLDEADHHLLRLMDFLSEGGEVEDVEVLVSPTIVACGHGRFVVEATISIHDFRHDDLDGEDRGAANAIVTLGRKMVVFSSAVGAIVWIGDSNPSLSAVPRLHDLTLSGCRHVVGRGSRIGCTLVAASTLVPTILLSEVDHTGQVHSFRQLEAAEIVRAELLASGWELEPRRSVSLMPDHVVAVDILTRDRGDDSRRYQSVLSFYPRHVETLSYDTLMLESTNVLYMERIRDEHLVLICEETCSEQSTTQGEDEDEDDIIGNLDGQWFDAGEDNTSVLVSTCVIVHVPTKQVIHRMPVINDIHEALEHTSPVLLASKGDTLGVGVWWKGIIMTGSDVRGVRDCSATSVVDSATSNSARKKKKKARQTHKAGKKDGFARGMSMRG